MKQTNSAGRINIYTHTYRLTHTKAQNCIRKNSAKLSEKMKPNSKYIYFNSMLSVLIKNIIIHSLKMGKGCTSESVNISIGLIL